MQATEQAEIKQPTAKPTALLFTTIPDVSVVVKTHNPGCDRKRKNCVCPKYLWATGKKGEFQRVSARTDSWEKAEERAKEYAKFHDPAEVKRRAAEVVNHVFDMPIDQALDELMSKKPGHSCKRKFSVIKNGLYGKKKGSKVFPGFLEKWNLENPKRQVRFVKDLSLVFLDAFQKTWTGRGEKITCSAADQKKRTISEFLNFCIERQWYPKTGFKEERGRLYQANPARSMVVCGITPEVTHEPFTDRLEQAVFDACDRYEASIQPAARKLVAGDGKMLKLLCQLMSATGFSLGDAYTAKRKSLEKDNYFEIKRMKTGKSVRVRITQEFADVLRKHVNPDSAEHFFWDGIGEPGRATNAANIYAKFRRLWKLVPSELLKDLTGKPDPHCFRNTKALRLFLSGASSSDVAFLLGDTVAVVEKHYRKMNEAMQTRLDRLNCATWKENRSEVILTAAAEKMIATQAQGNA